MTTVQETILSFPGLSEFPTNHIQHILGSRTLDGAADSGSVDKTVLNLAIADTLVLATNLYDFTENKLAVKYPREYFLKTARMLYVSNGEPLKAKALLKEIIVPRGKATNLW